mmetsp:Transcript_28943/g.33307  ORF Transcript_28943/g.33307 Transcript_28943/m.33307 type:complete len:109 (-) Transcript_28943:432-758(-)
MFGICVGFNASFLLRIETLLLSKWRWNGESIHFKIMREFGKSMHSFWNNKTFCNNTHTKQGTPCKRNSKNDIIVSKMNRFFCARYTLQQAVTIQKEQAAPESAMCAIF